MKKFFNNEQRKIIMEAIEDHRASLKYETRNNYGKIISSADRNTDLVLALKRTHAYTIKHYSDLDLDKMINRAYNHISKKFGNDGYAKAYCYDKEFEDVKKNVETLIKNKYGFAVKYMEVNRIWILKKRQNYLLYKLIWDKLEKVNLINQ